MIGITHYQDCWFLDRNLAWAVPLHYHHFHLVDLAVPVDIH